MGREEPAARTSPRWLGLEPDAAGPRLWDVFDAVLTPGRHHPAARPGAITAAAEAFEAVAKLPEGARLRRVRVVRDYGMFDRREAPQYYPDAKRPS